MLRRTKTTKGDDGQPIVNLPERIVQTEIVEFNEDEQKFYTDLELRCAPLVAARTVCEHASWLHGNAAACMGTRHIGTLVDAVWRLI